MSESVVAICLAEVYAISPIVFAALFSSGVCMKQLKQNDSVTAQNNARAGKLQVNPSEIVAIVGFRSGHLARDWARVSASSAVP